MSIIFVLVAMGLTNVWAYDFSAVAPSGQTLYYNIVDGNAEVTYPNASAYYRSERWSGYSRPTGDLVIPESVTYNGSIYSVKSIGDYVFQDCTGLTSVTIGNSVTTIGGSAFAESYGLTSVTIPNSVTTIGEWAFGLCSGLTSVTIPISVTSIGEMAFSGCSHLDTLYYNARSLQMGDFYNLGIKYLVIGDSVQTLPESVFHGLRGLKSVTIGNSVTTIENEAFYGCTNVDTLYFNARNLTTTSEWASGNINHKYYGFKPMKLKYLVIGDSVQTLPEGVFYGQDSLLSITIGNSVTTIEGSVFSGCSGLTSVTIPNSVTSIGSYTFSGCSGLTSVTIPNSVTSIESYTFSGCSGLTNVTIPNSVTSIESYTFSGCSGLTSVTIPNSVTSIGDYAFQNCSGLTSVIIGNSVTTIGKWAFRGCSGLTSVNIPNSVTSIGDDAFYYCSGLTSVTIPNSVTSIGSFTFSGCSGLISVTIPNSVTTIGGYAFRNCSGLTSVTIPNSVTSIGQSAFNGCSGLTSVTMKGSTPPTLLGSVFSNNASDRKIYVPCGAYADYYNATGWSEYRNDLSEPIVNIDVTVNTVDSEMGSASIIPWRGRNIRCDSTIIVRATANYGYHFDHWSTGSTQTQETIAIDDDTVITAYFAKNHYVINAVANYSERGNVLGSDTIEYLDSATISAEANYGYHFTRWNDNDTHSVRTVQVTQNMTYTAYFDFNQYQLIVNSSDTVLGSSLGSGIYDYLTNHTISATANYGYHFTQWSDGNTDNPRTIQLTQDTLFTAEFAKNQYAITLLCDDASLGSVNGGGTFDYLDTITLTAEPIDHHHFVRWNDGNRENPRQWVVTKDTAFTAYFAIDTHRVVVASNNIARGMVEASGTEFVYGTPCTVTATAYSGFTFAGWSNGMTANPYTFAVMNDVELTAMFISENEQLFTVTVVSDNPTMGSVSGGGMALSGGEVTIHAVANEGYHFVRWSDNDTNADRTITVTADATYTAYFAANTTQGINEAEGTIVRCRNGVITINGAEGESVIIFDVMGRVIVNETMAEGKLFRMPRNGVYLVKVGSHKAKKVVVMK